MGIDRTIWPSIHFEEVRWDVPADASASRLQRVRARGPRQAAIVPSIAGANPVISRGPRPGRGGTIEMVHFDRDLAKALPPSRLCCFVANPWPAPKLRTSPRGPRKSRWPNWETAPAPTHH